MKALVLLFSLAFGFFDVKSLFEKYDYYYNHTHYINSGAVGLKPIARLTVGAISDIGKGETLLKVPSEKVFTTFDDFPWANLFKDEQPDIKASAMLIFYKMDNQSSIERSEYVHQFNSDIEPPSYWLEDDMKVWFTKFVENPHRVKMLFPGFDRYKELAMKVEGLRSLGYEIKSYSWAQALTRTHGIDINRKQWKIFRGLPVEDGDENIKGYAFVPLFELFNQYLMPDNQHPVGEYPAKFEKGLFVLTAHRGFKLGEELYVPYRSKNNHQLYEDYGISIPHNSHEHLEVNVSTSTDLCDQMGEKGCSFFLGTSEINKNYLEYFKNDKNPMKSYRKGVKNEIKKFKFALRHQRRRVKILEDRHLKTIFHLSISEKWTAYKALALIDRQMLKSLMSLVRLA